MTSEVIACLNDNIGYIVQTWWSESGVIPEGVLQRKIKEDPRKRRKGLR
jgi:hypothetical protein